MGRLVTAPHIPTRVVAAFALLSLAFAIVVGWAIARERGREWRRIESEFDRLAGEHASGGADPRDRGVRQIWLPDLGRADRCVTCHRGIDDPAFAAAAQPHRAHPGQWLTTHPAERFGCTACHGGQGEATTWRGAAHEPIAHWPVPMRHGPLLEAGCGSCHREPRPRGAAVLAEGRERIARAGCAGCHDIPGFDAGEIQAPRLDSVGFKARPGWLRRYLAKPTVLAGARMPDFRLAPREVDVLDAFLRAQKAVAPLADGGVDWSRADPERGRELYARARCVTCHRVDGRGGTLGPDLSHAGSRVTREWLWSYLIDPFRDQPDTLMPRFTWTSDEARDIASYLLEILVDPGAPGDASTDPPPGAQAAGDGRALFIKRGCAGCHRLSSVGDVARIGPSLAGVGERAVESADFGDRQVEPSIANWLYLKVQAPEAITQPSSMPTFAMTDADRLPVVVALLSLARRSPPAAPVAGGTAAALRQPQGRVGEIFTRYRCLSCHEWQGGGGRLSTVALDRIGSQLRPEYLAQYLQRPVPVRIGLDVRMPRLNISKAEADAIVDYARRVLIDDRLEAWTPPPREAAAQGEKLYETLGCGGCHGIAGKGGYVGPDLTGVGRRLRPGWMTEWLVAPGQWKPETVHPDYGLTREQANSLTAFLLTLTGGARTR